MLGAIAIGSIICMVASIAGDTSQDLKTGYLLGATPRKQQYGEIIGVVAAYSGNRWCFISAECRLGIWFAGTAGSAGDADEDGGRRRYGSNIAVDAGAYRSRVGDCGRDRAYSGTSLCSGIVPSDSFEYRHYGRRFGTAVF